MLAPAAERERSAPPWKQTKSHRPMAGLHTMGSGPLCDLDDAPLLWTMSLHHSWRATMGMQVVFYKVDNGRLCA
jgi:hypothetical protein